MSTNAGTLARLLLFCQWLKGLKKCSAKIIRLVLSARKKSPDLSRGWGSGFAEEVADAKLPNPDPEDERDAGEGERIP